MKVSSVLFNIFSPYLSGLANINIIIRIINILIIIIGTVPFKKARFLTLWSEVLLGSWVAGSNYLWIRSFKWVTVCPFRSRGCKNIRGQSWRFKKIDQISQAPGASVSNLAESAISYRPPTLTSDIFAASWPTRAYSTSFERSDSYLFGDWKPGPWHDF